MIGHDIMFDADGGGGQYRFPTPIEIRDAIVNNYEDKNGALGSFGEDVGFSYRIKTDESGKSKVEYKGKRQDGTVILHNEFLLEWPRVEVDNP